MGLSMGYPMTELLLTGHPDLQACPPTGLGWTWKGAHPLARGQVTEE
jgi:hypothetical protein